jgi:hypothetical protein
MATIEPAGIPREKPPHHSGDRRGACSHQEMDVLCEVPNYVKLSSLFPRDCFRGVWRSRMLVE